METKKTNEVDDSEIVPRPTSKSTEKNLASVTMEKPIKANAKLDSLKIHVKSGGSNNCRVSYRTVR